MFCAEYTIGGTEATGYVHNAKRKMGLYMWHRVSESKSFTVSIDIPLQ